MAELSLPCVLVFGPLFSQWTPDHWISAVRVLVWPVFWGVLLLTLRQRVTALCDVAVKLLEGAAELEIAGLKYKRLPAEAVDPVKSVNLAVRITEQLPEDPPKEPQDVPERLIQLPKG